MTHIISVKYKRATAQLIKLFLYRMSQRRFAGTGKPRKPKDCRPVHVQSLPVRASNGGVMPYSIGIHIPISDSDFWINRIISTAIRTYIWTEVQDTEEQSVIGNFPLISLSRSRIKGKPLLMEVFRAFLAPALTTLEQYAGWQGLFIITGIVGVLWGITWYFFYRDPGASSKANEAELNYIENGGGLIDRKNHLQKKEPRSFQWGDLKEVFSHKKLWGIYLGQFAVGATLWFFLTWFPTYLVKYRHIDFIKSGFLASLPFLSAFVGILSAGFISDYMIKKGASMSVARKTPIIIGLLLTMCIIGANYVSSPALIILFMCIAFFGNGFASITWVFVSTLAPKHLIGLTGGVFNFIGGLAGIIVPATIGYIVTNDNFTPAIILIGVIGVLGALSYIFLVGKVERVMVKEIKNYIQ